MGSSFFHGFFTIENIRHLLEGYHSFGPLFGILLPLLESFLPLLPLLLIAAANAAAYGFWTGSFLSWFGTCLGSVLVFLFFRKLARGRLKRWLEKSKRIRRTLEWVEAHGFGPIFLLYCFPFTPSLLVNVAAGLSKLSLRSYLSSLLLGKMVMIFMASYVGYDWIRMIHRPFKLLVIALIVVILWIIGKRIENRIQNTKTAAEKTES